jgi:uroporphyrinogen III methyltransferase/synthase
MLTRSLLTPEAGGEGFDAVCFASGKTARHFIATLEEVHGPATTRALLARAKVIALGPVTADAITALDLRVDAVAAEISDEAMLAAVLTALQRD